MHDGNEWSDSAGGDNTDLHLACWTAQPDCGGSVVLCNGLMFSTSGAVLMQLVLFNT